jgi:hypothetical protein
VVSQDILGGFVAGYRLKLQQACSEDLRETFMVTLGDILVLDQLYGSTKAAKIINQSNCDARHKDYDIDKCKTKVSRIKKNYSLKLKQVNQKCSRTFKESISGPIQYQTPIRKKSIEQKR